MKNKAKIYNSETLKRFMGRSNAKRKARVEQQLLLANIIYDAMRAKGWNQEEFAQKMNKVPSEISKWVSGTHNFTSDTLFEISDVLGVELINLKTSNRNPNLVIFVASIQGSNDMAHVGSANINDSNKKQSKQAIITYDC